MHEVEGRWQTVTPIVLGHEASGVVEQVGAGVFGIRPGDRVVTCISASCGSCRYCTNGQLTLCERRAALNTDRIEPRLLDSSGQSVRPTAGIGAFAEYMTVHHSCAVVIPDDIPMDVASILGCAVVTGVGAAIRGAKIKPGETAVVIGCGGVGAAAIQGARLAGAARIIAVDVTPGKLELARALGATDVVDASEVDPVAAVRELTKGGVDHALEIVGTSRTVQQAFEMLVPGGKATVVGLVPDEDPVRIRASELFFSEKTLTGTFMGSNNFRTDIPRYLEF
ncbi:zinc-binding dehydrogenase, partial [Nocardia pseudovaccinii]|uniref:zinc-binding dehydrogenase n=1 Tax=Nocardia pseudovaccinii TaxID=189540 RepID=UPI001FDF78F3